MRYKREREEREREREKREREERERERERGERDCCLMSTEASRPIRDGMLHSQVWTYIIIIYRSMPVGTYRVQSPGFRRLSIDAGRVRGVQE